MFQARKPCRLSPKQTMNRHLVESQFNELFNIRIVTLHFVNRILTRHQAMKRIELKLWFFRKTQKDLAVETAQGCFIIISDKA
jgi:hypothetical protein